MSEDEEPDHNLDLYMRGTRTFCQRGSNFQFDNLFWFLFLVDEDPSTTKSWPSSARRRAKMAQH